MISQKHTRSSQLFDSLMGYTSRPPPAAPRALQAEVGGGHGSFGPVTPGACGSALLLVPRRRAARLRELPLVRRGSGERARPRSSAVQERGEIPAPGSGCSFPRLPAAPAHGGGGAEASLLAPKAAFLAAPSPAWGRARPRGAAPRRARDGEGPGGLQPFARPAPGAARPPLPARPRRCRNRRLSQRSPEGCASGQSLCPAGRPRAEAARIHRPEGTSLSRIPLPAAQGHLSAGQP